MASWNHLLSLFGITVENQIIKKDFKKRESLNKMKMPSGFSNYPLFRENQTSKE